MEKEIQGENLDEKITEEVVETPENSTDTQFDINSEENNPEELDKQIASLNAQRQWEKRKRHEAEERIQQLQEEIAEFKNNQTSIPSGNEQDLSQIYPDWEFMDDNTRNILQKMQGLENKLQELTIEKEKIKAKEKWEEDFNNLTQKYPELKNNNKQFKEFTDKEEYKNIPLSVLGELFVAKTVGNNEVKNEGLEKNISGERKINKELSFEHISILRKTDPQEYMRLIREKRLKMPRE